MLQIVVCFAITTTGNVQTKLHRFHILYICISSDCVLHDEVVLFNLILDVPVNIFHSCLKRSPWVEPVLSIG